MKNITTMEFDKTWERLIEIHAMTKKEMVAGIMAVQPHYKSKTALMSMWKCYLAQEYISVVECKKLLTDQIN